MTQSVLPVVLFVIVIACIPLALKWLRLRSGLGAPDSGHQTKLISTLAVGPHQRVVTVEVGLEGARQRLTLGVTPQSITCLHAAAVESPVRSIESKV